MLFRLFYTAEYPIATEMSPVKNYNQLHHGICFPVNINDIFSKKWASTDRQRCDNILLVKVLLNGQVHLF